MTDKIQPWYSLYSPTHNDWVRDLMSATLAWAEAVHKLQTASGLAVFENKDPDTNAVTYFFSPALAPFAVKLGAKPSRRPYRGEVSLVVGSQQEWALLE